MSISLEKLKLSLSLGRMDTKSCLQSSVLIIERALSSNSLNYSSNNFQVIDYKQNQDLLDSNTRKINICDFHVESIILVEY